MVNHFRADMPMPLVGIGHSLGANILCNLSFLHPRLFSTVVLMDPVIQSHGSAMAGLAPAYPSSIRRDLWPSRAEAEASFRKSKFYSTWDSRVLDRWCQYGVRETPTALYPNEEGTVTLSTTKHQECFHFLRPSFGAFSEGGETVINRDLVIDMDARVATYPFYRAEPPSTFARLGELRPSALYIFGETSDMSQPNSRKAKMDATGIGLGGSGGAAMGRVKEAVLKGVGHMVAMEASNQCAEVAGVWLGQELARFSEEKKAYVEWTKQSLPTKSMLSDEYLRHLVTGFSPGKAAKKAKL